MPLRLYTFAHYLILPLLLLYLCWRGLRNPAYFKHWEQRFGFSEPIANHHRVVWIHAVSVGEVQAAVPLVRMLQLQHDEAQLLITTTTPTGAERVRQTLGGDVRHCYVPYDLPSALGRFLQRTHPQLAIMMETELWPNMFAMCRHRSIPVVVVNARLSERAARRYRRLSGLVRSMLGSVDAVAAQTAADAERFIALGSPPEKVVVTGSIKFDFEVPAEVRQAAADTRRAWGAQRPVWIAASTHEGEDEQVLEAFAQVLSARNDTLLVLVPRHPERFGKVATLCRRHGYRTVRHSQQANTCARAQIFIGDTMGELLRFYGAADVAFVGGSLVPVGGHNPLEPAALGLPVIMGPHVFNFSDISARLRAAGAATIVGSASQLAEAVIELLRDGADRRRRGQRGKHFVEQNRGALAQVLQVINQLLASPAEAYRAPP